MFRKRLGLHVSTFRALYLEVDAVNQNRLIIVPTIRVGGAGRGGALDALRCRRVLVVELRMG